jgi:hypothetical protein
MDGRLELFGAVPPQGWLLHTYQATPGGGWGAWLSLGGNLSNGPAVARNADGRLEVFAAGTDQTVWHIAQVSPGGNWGN